ncbi:Transcription antitermination protein RfaH [Pseudoalteromonas holothuriae]|uniref:Transcription antitermination protein RfaH n=1 Tax=Pseudoalteromonas holothuriae TaxID=2963714 RepID=A0A9W4VYA0_9GAMM|nr:MULTISPECIES: UpxY family transcription antiterminator [unclassified Pseudoalteromonas]CAH9053845.1 Transcription antitermination protein RfaH [Pseudoalteromonas sp. CIP111951]CAH9055770.1 Transcription antitermination protein RfaH [Pseudoalteromonas sp. CIP111854]
MINQRQWFVVYTKANCEKKLAEQVNKLQSGCEAFLPAIEKTKQWSDRVKVVTTPLFKSYVFVYIDGNEFQQLKRFAGFVSYIKFNNAPAVISPKEIEKIKRCVLHGHIVDVLTKRLVKGAAVEIISGSLKGYQGTLVERRSQKLVAVEVEGLEQSMVLTLPIELLKPVTEG